MPNNSNIKQKAKPPIAHAPEKLATPPQLLEKIEQAKATAILKSDVGEPPKSFKKKEKDMWAEIVETAGEQIKSMDKFALTQYIKIMIKADEIWDILLNEGFTTHKESATGIISEIPSPKMEIWKKLVVQGNVLADKLALSPKGRASLNKGIVIQNLNSNMTSSEDLALIADLAERKLTK